MKKVHRVIKFNQKSWLKSYINMNTDLRQKGKKDFENDFFNFNNAVFEKLMEMRENIDILNLSQQKEEETIWCKK